MSKKYKKVDLPEYHFNDSDENNLQVLVNFYKKLGFDPDLNTINPRKVFLNKLDLDDMLNKFLEPGEIKNLDSNNKLHIEEIARRKNLKVELNMLWLNYGPSFDKKSQVPRGKVLLLDGYLE